jgi:hypothetical protein
MTEHAINTREKVKRFAQNHHLLDGTSSVFFCHICNAFNANALQIITPAYKL